MIGETTHITFQNKQQLLPSTKQELPAWIYNVAKSNLKVYDTEREKSAGTIFSHQTHELCAASTD